jgi:DNA-binding protein H-NS
MDKLRQGVSSFENRRAAMAKPSLSRMDVQSLMDLRKRVEEALFEHRAVLEKQLALLHGETAISARRRGGRRRSTLKGRKVPAKYRDRSGNTWAGRGAKPRWLVAAMKGGRKLESFLIKK